MEIEKKDKAKRFPLFIILFFLLMGIIFITKNNIKTSISPKAPMNSKTVSVKDIPRLQKADGQNYVFYYPKEYSKSDEKSSQDRIYYRDAKKETYSEIGLTVYSNEEKMESSSLAYCRNILESHLNSDKKITIDNIKPLDFEKSYGCDSWVTNNSFKEKVKFYSRLLWYKNGSDTKTYSAIASYAINLQKDKKDLLDLAISNFTLK